MTTATLSAADLRVRDLVLQQLGWDSMVDASGVGVAARNGVVTLSGTIDSYAGKLAAERAAKRVHGVRAVANDLQVTLRQPRSDTDIATDAVRALETHLILPPTIQVVVHNAHVVLTGTVHTLFQRVVAEKALRYVKGVKNLVNRLVVAPTSSAPDIRPRIVRALHQDADIDARGLNVVVSGSNVTLTGTVRSWHERDSAERAAMHAPGITHVENLIAVVWPEDEDSRAQDDMCCDHPRGVGTTSTGHVAVRIAVFVFDPKTIRSTAPRPCTPITIRSAASSAATCWISRAGFPSFTRAVTVQYMRAPAGTNARSRR